MIAIYARQSVDKKDSISIETQIAYCQKEISDPDEKIEVFQDKGFSGKNMNRPAFSKMMDGIQEGKFSKIIVYRLDRISRSITDFAGIMDILSENKTDFVSTTEKFDTSTPMGRAMLYIIMVFAQLERETIAERIRDNYYSRGKLGVWLGGPAPFGFEISKTKQNGKNVSTLRPTKELELVKQIYKTYSETPRSLGELGRSLKNKFGDQYGIWNNIKLSRILHNPIYVCADVDIYHYFKDKGCIMTDSIEQYTGDYGLAIYGKRDRAAFKYRHLSEQVVSLSLTKGVIDSETYLQCQYKLEKNTQIKNTGKGKHSWLTGLVKCGYCGYSMTVRCYGETKYLHCSGKSINECDQATTTQYVADIEKFINNSILEYIKNADIAEINSAHSSVDTETNNLKIELYKIEEQITNLINSLANAQDVTMNYINQKIAELDQEKAEIQKRIEERYTKKEQIHIPTEQEWLDAEFQEKREIAHQLIEKIFIKKDSINITWKY